MVLRIMRSLIFLVFILGPLYAIDEYPIWFLYPNRFPGIIVGYSYNGLSAKTDAENMYCAYRSCVVNGTLEIFEDTDQDQWLKNSDYYYYYSPDSLLKIQGKLVGIDSFMTNVLTGDYIGAYSFNKEDSLPNEWLKVASLSAPEWAFKTFWEEEQFVYGVGMFSAKRNENDAWKTAEEQAIFTILTNMAVSYHRIKILNQDESGRQAAYQEISFLHLKYYLRNIEILERFPDIANKTFYVLARIAKKDIISPMLKN